MPNFSDKVALITGSSSGIGRSTALAFSAARAKVVLAARREADLEALAAEIQDKGAEATYVRTDVTVAEDVERMVAHTIQAYGCLDFAVNNAGVEGPLVPITDLREQDWDRVINTNLKGTYLCVKYEARAMLEGGRGGAIVNLGSISSFRGSPSGSAYAASKHGLVGLTVSASADLAPNGIRVNLICPGVIDTPMDRRLRDIIGDKPFEQALQQRVHARRSGQPEEVAAAILFLCSADASYITGSALTADGGFTLSA